MAATPQDPGNDSTRKSNSVQWTEDRAAEWQRRLRQEAVDRRYSAWNRLVEARGKRYANCGFESFTAANETQGKAAETLKRYASDVPQRITDGTGLLLYGPSGTGKDHLAMCVAKEFIRADVLGFEFRDGAELFAKLRDTFGDRKGEDEMDIVRQLSRCAILYLADPLPPSGELKPYQSEILKVILDRRYSNLKPTFCTVNVTGREELEARMGVAIADRLRDGAVAIACAWPSYRRTANV